MINFNVEDFINYRDLLLLDEDYKSKYKLIENNHLIHENINSLKIKPIIPNDKDNYGLNVAILNMMLSMNITNELVVESHEIYNKIKSNSIDIQVLNSYYYAKYYELNRMIVHNIRHYCDEIITIFYLLSSSAIVSDIGIGSISAYFLLDEDKRIYKTYEDFLHIILDLDNSFKHFFSEVISPNRIGVDNNCIVTYYSKYGKNFLNPNKLSYKLDDIIILFNSFYKEFIKKVEELCKC